MNPLVSVVMPVYNGEKYLREAIESILNQTFKNFEFIIINDGSTDKSLEIIENYQNIDERIQLISRENKGLITSLNEGIQKSKGKYIARMDADDVSLTERFEKQVELMEECEVDICGCHYFVINEENKYIDSKIVPISQDAVNINIAYSVPFAHGSVLMKRDLFQKFIYGNTAFSTVEDYALWINMYMNNVKFSNVDEFLFKYRDFPNSFSKTKISNMELDRYTLSKQVVVIYSQKLQLSIDNQLKKELSYWEEVYLVRISLLMWYRVKDVRKKINNQTFLFSFLSYVKQKVLKII